MSLTSHFFLFMIVAGRIHNVKYSHLLFLFSHMRLNKNTLYAPSAGIGFEHWALQAAWIVNNWNDVSYHTAPAWYISSNWIWHIFGNYIVRVAILTMVYCAIRSRWLSCVCSILTAEFYLDLNGLSALSRAFSKLMQLAHTRWLLLHV